MLVMLVRFCLMCDLELFYKIGSHFTNQPQPHYEVLEANTEFEVKRMSFHILEICQIVVLLLFFH